MRILNSAVLFSLALALPVSANPRIDSPLPSQQAGAPPAEDKETQKPLASPALTRGQQLYENHCMACHESVIHIRTRHQAKSLTDIHQQVTRWANYSKLHWSRDETSDVVQYLNSQYYRFER